MMKHDPSFPVATGCDAIQQQLSDLADSGAPLTPALQAHLDACPACAAFAAQWLSGPPAALAFRSTQTSDGPLRQRILALARPNVVAFAAVPATPRLWVPILTRIAACLALAGFTYWLLDPVTSSIKPRLASVSPPTLTEGLLMMEDRSKQEQTVLQTALVEGGRHVSRNVNWTMSALE